MFHFFAQLNIGGKQIQGPKIINPATGAQVNNLSDIINVATYALIPLAGIILFVTIIWAGYDYLLSRGSAENIKKAQAKLTGGFVGFVLLLLSYFIVRLIAFVFGLESGIF
ncbi:MAG: hypothetical protein WCO06_02440 [Candidatus Roizmanbacteria bacterium]